MGGSVTWIQMKNYAKSNPSRAACCCINSEMVDIHCVKNSNCQVVSLIDMYTYLEGFFFLIDVTPWQLCGRIVFGKYETF